MGVKKEEVLKVDMRGCTVEGLSVENKMVRGSVLRIWGGGKKMNNWQRKSRNEICAALLI